MANSKRRCRECIKYLPAESGVIINGAFYCSMEHALDYANANKCKQITRAKNQKHKERKEAIRDKSWYWKEALKWSNKYNRISDPYDSCCSCDRTNEEILRNDGWKPGGCFDAGHYLSRGSRSDLAFTEDNIWRQCKSCNAGEGKFGRMSSKADTVSKRYREKLIERIGIERVEALEFNPGPRKWTVDELKEIISKYKAKCREFESGL